MTITAVLAIFGTGVLSGGLAGYLFGTANGLRLSARHRRGL